MKQSGEQSDSLMYFDLVQNAELVLKLVTAAMIAALTDDRERTRYRQVYRLVRASSPGEWFEVLAEVVAGPPSQHLVPEARDLQVQLTRKVDQGWLRDAVETLDETLSILKIQRDPLGRKTNFLYWASLIARLRNKGPAHGSQPTRRTSEAAGPLARSVALVEENCLIFQQEWAYLKRNLSQKYNVVAISESASSFDFLKTTKDEQLPEGVYIFLGGARYVELVRSDVDLSDFFVANGAFTARKYELKSYITGEILDRPSQPYLVAADDLPPSRTDAIGELEVRGACLTNMPTRETGYIERPDLEGELLRYLRDEELYRVVTLHGRGGVGKTSIALKVLSELQNEDRYFCIFWFSARDIDLLADGPKTVKAQVLSVEDMSREYAEAVGATIPKDGGASSVLAADMCCADRPTLFVFDNFETVEKPEETYGWIDSHVRHPAKALITTRHREFRGDFPIEVRGMTGTQASQLIDAHSRKLGIRDLISSEYERELIRESDGHPYVIKILLGEVAAEKRAISVKQILARREEMLQALFERTYSNLSPLAQRVFLTVSSWRSSVPLIALQAAMLRSSAQRLDVQDAIDELERFSFVEVVKSEVDESYFVQAPLAATLFGKKKLKASEFQAAVEIDSRFLQMFGVARRPEVSQGLRPRIETLLSRIAEQVERGDTALKDEQDLFEYLGNVYPETWLSVSELYQESGDLEEARSAVQKYIENSDAQCDADVWERLAVLSNRIGDVPGELNAWVGLSRCPGIDFFQLSHAANKVNALFKSRVSPLDREEKRTLIRQLIDSLRAREDEATASDHSRIAWLYLNIGDEAGARVQVEKGLELDSSNYHCLRLKSKLR